MLVTLGTSPESSVAVGSVQNAMPLVAPAATWTLTSLGQLEIVGGVTSTTTPEVRMVTSNEQVAMLPDASLKV